MCSIATNNSGGTAVDDGAFLQINRSDNGSRGRGGETREQLRQLAQKVMSGIAGMDPSHSKELLGVFVSELFLLAEERELRETRRRKQAEGIAAAKRRGVQFGRERMELPENFPEFARLWQEGGISTRRAAKELGISHQTFRRRAKEYCAVQARPR